MSTQILIGDCREVLKTLPENSVQCVVTSPPYYGLRDYGHTQQIGLESTPEAYVAEMVAVFREVRRVLRGDGVCWLNLGDSYAGGKQGRSDDGSGDPTSKLGPKHDGCPNNSGMGPVLQRPVPAGLKPKDLIGIPWSVAKALQAPSYTGRIKSELDRVWLAATIDAEGSICGFTHERKDDGTIRTGIHLTITNTNKPLLDNAFRIWPTSREDHNFHGEGHLGSADTYRWIAHNVDSKAELLREIYPYLIAKKKQALLAWNFLEMSREAKRLARTKEADSIKEKRAWIVASLSKLNHFEDVDIPSWCIEPPSMYEPGWFLRQDLIWNKPNPMPESVTDRCTKSHEYVFLLSKSARYFYDAEGVKEESAESTIRIHSSPSVKSVNIHDAGWKVAQESKPSAKTKIGNGAIRNLASRNRRSVWTIATQPYSGAHFATMPPKLAETCILAGTSEAGCCSQCGQAWVRVVEKIGGTWEARKLAGAPIRDGMETSKGTPMNRKAGSESTTLGFRPACTCNAPAIPCTVLDPFGGSGTTGEVAQRLGRDAILIELNPDYLHLADRRTAQGGLMLGNTSEPFRNPSQTVSKPCLELLGGVK